MTISSEDYKLFLYNGPLIFVLRDCYSSPIIYPTICKYDGLVLCFNYCVRQEKEASKIIAAMLTQQLPLLSK